jgi:hypothetical protein
LWISSNINDANPSWTLVSNYPFRQPERVFFNPFNPAEIWVTSFGNGLKLGTQSVALPIRLISFSGSRNKNISALQWVTAGEDNGDRFNIERSTDGLHFSQIASVDGKGGPGNQYQLADTVGAPVLYYRIKVISAAGSYFYSRIIVLRDNDSHNSYVRVMTNPVTGSIPLQASVEKPTHLHLQLVDLNGREVLQQEILLQPGVRQLNIAVPFSSRGVYLLRATGGAINKTMRVVLVQ